jgi:hypothetical protein
MDWEDAQRLAIHCELENERMEEARMAASGKNIERTVMRPRQR